jgi:hypothetical protein
VALADDDASDAALEARVRAVLQVARVHELALLDRADSVRRLVRGNERRRRRDS